MSRKELWSVVRRLQFVKLALKAQQTMSQLCRLFGISRKNGYKWKARFEREGLMGLCDRPRHPRPIGLRLRRKGIHAVYFSTELIGELWESDLGGIRPAKRVRR